VNYKLINFQVLGPKEIFVPTHLFKVVILKISDKDAWKYWLESYVLTNTNLDELFDEKQSKFHYLNMWNSSAKKILGSKGQKN